MPDLEANIPIIHLRSPKKRVQFRSGRGQTPGQSFFDLVEAYRSGGTVDPIQVVRTTAGFVILDGVRRALAAKAAGLSKVDARVARRTSVGRSIGATVPLSAVLFPHDHRR